MLPVSKKEVHMLHKLKRISTPLLVLTFVLSGLFAVVPKASAEYACGSQCNGHSPGWIIPSNGVQCNNSETQIASGHPTATYNKLGPDRTYDRVTETDSLITIKVMYSTVCQTMWAVVTNSHAGVPSNCDVTNTRTVSYSWSESYSCPGVGTTKTYPMVDDYISTHTIAAKVSYDGSLNRSVCLVTAANGTCQSSDSSYPVNFHYSKSY